MEEKFNCKLEPGLPEPRLVPPVLQVRQWHTHPGDLWQWASLQRGTGSCYFGQYAINALAKT